MNLVNLVNADPPLNLVNLVNADPPLNVVKLVNLSLRCLQGGDRCWALRLQRHPGGAADGRVLGGGRLVLVAAAGQRLHVLDVVRAPSECVCESAQRAAFFCPSPARVRQRSIRARPEPDRHPDVQYMSEPDTVKVSFFSY